MLACPYHPDMDPTVQAAFIAAAAALVGVGGTVAVAFAGSRTTRLTNQATLNAAAATTDKMVQAVLDTNQATIDATRRGQLTDRYAKAVEHLGDSNLDTRLGGIYALEGVARDSETDHPAVMEMLTAFIREHSREQWPLPKRDTEPAPPREIRPDVQAALTVIGRRDAKDDIRPIDLSGAELADAKLPHGAHFVAARLAGVDLSRVDLGGVDLTDVDLTEEVLIRAVLRPVDLTDAEPDDVKLPRGEYHVVTRLVRADLTEADISDAIFTGAILTDAKWPKVREFGRAGN
jgi:hypothetical protein